MTTTEHNNGEKAGRSDMKNFDDLDFTDNFMFQLPKPEEILYNIYMYGKSL